MTHISVCVATYRRPEMLARLLQCLLRQETLGQFSYSIVVADNDASESARSTVLALAESTSVSIDYLVEPRRSISHVRNALIANSTSELIAFIDDDEFPEPSWLLHLNKVIQSHKCAGVLAPVRAFYPEGAPTWVKRSRLFDRPEHPTGFTMPWEECRTGNVLFRRSIIAGQSEVFDPQFGTGGSDVDFFRRMIQAGHRFVWCNEGFVYEEVAPSRWQRRTLMKRALLRGQNSFRHVQGRRRNVVKAVVAVPLYALALPILLLLGHHLFIRYLIKLCDHTGRLMASLGFYPVKTRAM